MRALAKQARFRRKLRNANKKERGKLLDKYHARSQKRSEKFFGERDAIAMEDYQLILNGGWRKEGQLIPPSVNVLTPEESRQKIHRIVDAIDRYCNKKLRYYGPLDSDDLTIPEQDFLRVLLQAMPKGLAALLSLLPQPLGLEFICAVAELETILPCEYELVRGKSSYYTINGKKPC